MEIYKQMKANEERIAKISPKETVLGHLSEKVVLKRDEYETLRKSAENGVYVDAVKITDQTGDSMTVSVSEIA